MIDTEKEKEKEKKRKGVRFIFWVIARGEKRVGVGSELCFTPFFI
jgi:hypothetical protein